VDEVLNGVNSLLSESSSNDGVIGEGDSGSVDFTVSSLVDESLDVSSGGVTVGDVRLDHSDHVDGGSGHSDEHSVVELSESEELHDLLALGAQLVDTSSSDDKGNLSLSFNVEVSGLLGSSLGLNEVGVLLSVLSGVLDGVGGGGGSGSDTGGLGGGTGFDGGLEELGVSGGFLGDVLRYEADPKKTIIEALAIMYC